MTMFTIAVSGSRDITDRNIVSSILDAEASEQIMLGHELSFHLGDAAGVDHSALLWARDNAMSRTLFFADRKGFEFWRRSFGMKPDINGEGDQALALLYEQAHLVSDWDRDGKYAGPIRNHAMIVGGNGISTGKADLLVIIYPSSGITPGTKNARATARNNNVEIHPYEVTI